MNNTLKVLWAAFSLSAISLPAHAQFGDGQTGRDQTRRQNRGGQPNDRGRGGNGGVFELPEGVSRVISIDAQNVLLAEMEGEDGQKEYVAIRPRHIYSGGLARLFGGDVIPTEEFVSPAFANGGGFGNNVGNGNGFNGNNNFNGQNNGFNGQNNGPVFGGFNNGLNAGGLQNNGGLVPNAPQSSSFPIGGVFPANAGYFSGQNRIAPRNTRGKLSIQSSSPTLNRVVGLLDRPITQIEIGTTATAVIESAN